jgi:hypothetical protein
MKKIFAQSILLAVFIGINNQGLQAKNISNRASVGASKRHVTDDNLLAQRTGVAYGFPFECEEAASYLRQYGVAEGAEGSIIYGIEVPRAQAYRAIRLLKHRYQSTREFHIDRQPHIFH